MTHLWLLDPALLEGTGAGVMGTVVPVFTPVALIRAAHTGQTSGIEQRGWGNGVGRQCGSAANTPEHRCLMTNYLCIHYDYQEFAGQCQSNKSI